MDRVRHHHPHSTHHAHREREWLSSDVDSIRRASFDVLPRQHQQQQRITKGGLPPPHNRPPPPAYGHAVPYGSKTLPHQRQNVKRVVDRPNDVHPASSSDVEIYCNDSEYGRKNADALSVRQRNEDSGEYRDSGDINYNSNFHGSIDQRDDGHYLASRRNNNGRSDNENLHGSQYNVADERVDSNLLQTRMPFNGRRSPQSDVTTDRESLYADRVDNEKLSKNRSNSWRPDRPDYLDVENPKPGFPVHPKLYPDNSPKDKSHLDNIIPKPQPNNTSSALRTGSFTTANIYENVEVDKYSENEQYFEGHPRNNNSNNNPTSPFQNSVTDSHKELLTNNTTNNNNNNNNNNSSNAFPSPSKPTGAFPSSTQPTHKEISTNDKSGDDKLPKTIYKPSVAKSVVPSASEMIRLLNNQNKNDITTGAVSNKTENLEGDNSSSAGSQQQQPDQTHVSNTFRIFFNAKTIERAPSKAKDIAAKFNKSLALQQPQQNETPQSTKTEHKFDNTLQRLNKEGKISARCPKCKWRKVDAEGAYCQECRIEYLVDLKQRVACGDDQSGTAHAAPAGTLEKLRKCDVNKFKCVQCGWRLVEEEDGYCDNCESEYL